MKRLLIIVLLLGVINAKEIKYECGIMGTFPASINPKDLQLDIYLDEKKSMILNNGHGKKMSTSEYEDTVRNKNQVVYDRYRDKTTGALWIFQRYKEKHFYRMYWKRINIEKLVNIICFDKGKRALYEN